MGDPVSSRKKPENGTADTLELFEIMQIIPAVDIKNGKCVRLTQGKPDTAIVYEEDPLKAALYWEGQGAEYLHIVDLDGAFKGEPVNFDTIKRILSNIKILAEVGGGIRTLETVKKYIDMGADRVVLGTQIASSTNFLKKVIDLYGDKVAVAIDAACGKVLVEGWAKTTDIFALKFAQTVRSMGVKTIIYTDTTVDGTLKGPNFGNIEEFVKKIKTNIVISGGISSIEDIRRIRQMEAVTGIIIGKALYTGKIKLSEAQKIC